MKNYKTEGLKYILFIGIPVIIILGVLGAYYYMTNPLTVLTRTINTAYLKLENFKTNSLNPSNIKENPILWKANASFQTDIEELKNLQTYNYGIQIGLDYKQEYLETTFEIKEEEKEILQSSFYQIKDKQYFKNKQIFEKLIELEPSQLPFLEQFHLERLEEMTQKIDISTAKEILKEIKDIFLKSLDKKYITREKKDITINDETIKTTKITYLLNKENQDNTKNFIVNQIQRDDKLMIKLETLLEKSEEEIKEMLKEWKEKNYKKDYSIELYTEGINQNVIRIILTEENQNLITYTQYKEVKTINLYDELFLSINDWSQEKIDIDYSFLESKTTGTIKLTTEEKNKDETSYNFFLKLTSPEWNADCNLTLEIQKQPKLEIPDITEAVKIEDLTENELQTLLENIEANVISLFLYNI